MPRSQRQIRSSVFPGQSGAVHRIAQACRRGFTLIELLTVMAVILVLLGLSVPAFNAIKSGNDLTKATYDIAGIFEQARTLAMSTHTYVFLGLVEVDDSMSEAANPQTAASATTGGRVAVFMCATRDGTRGYSLNAPATSWMANYSAADDGTTKPAAWRLVAVNKLARFENVHFATLPNPASGTMHRPTVNTSDTPGYLVGTTSCTSVTPITYPLGAALAAGQYNFNTVINFDPRGVARIQGATNSDDVDRYIEVGLQPTHANAVPPGAVANQGAQAAIQIDCMTGAVRIYRP